MHPTIVAIILSLSVKSELEITIVTAAINAFVHESLKLLQGSSVVFLVLTAHRRDAPGFEPQLVDGSHNEDPALGAVVMSWAR
jgi:hypothetical protein